MNIIALQERLKDLPEQALMQEMQMPTGTAPQFLVLSELKRRKRMRDDYQRMQAQNMPTVAEETVAAAGVPQQGIMQMARAMAPKSAIAQDTGVNDMMHRDATRAPQPEAMADGGYVRRALEIPGFLDSDGGTADAGDLTHAINQSARGAEFAEFLNAVGQKGVDIAAEQFRRAVGLGLGIDAALGTAMGETAAFLGFPEAGAKWMQSARDEMQYAGEVYSGERGPLGGRPDEGYQVPDSARRMKHVAEVSRALEADPTLGYEGLFTEQLPAGDWESIAAARISPPPTTYPTGPTSPTGVATEDPFDLARALPRTPNHSEYEGPYALDWAPTQRPQEPTRPSLYEWDPALAASRERSFGRAEDALSPTLAEIVNQTGLADRIALAGEGYMHPSQTAPDRFPGEDRINLERDAQSFETQAVNDARRDRGSEAAADDARSLGAAITEDLTDDAAEITAALTTPKSTTTTSGGAGFGSLDSRIAQMLAQRQKQAESDKWMALAYAGMEMMKPTPTIGEGLGNAGQAGLSYLQQSRKGLQDFETDMLKLQAEMDIANRRIAASGSSKNISASALTALEKMVGDAQELALENPSLENIKNYRTLQGMLEGATRQYLEQFGIAPQAGASTGTGGAKSVNIS